MKIKTVNKEGDIVDAKVGSVKKTFTVEKPTSIEDLEVKEEMDVVLQKKTFKKIVRELSKNRIIIDKDFQRDEIYKILQKSGIINSAILGKAIPPLYAYEERDEKGRVVLSIIDGQQRIASVRGFMNDEYALKIPFGELSILNGYKYSQIKEINPDFADQIADITLDINIIRNIDKKQAQQYFGLINTTTTPLSPGEKLRSIPDPVGTILEGIVENNNFKATTLRKSRDGEYVIATKLLWNEMFMDPLKHEFIGNKISEFMNYFNTIESIKPLEKAQKSLFELLELYSNVIKNTKFAPRSQSDLYVAICFLSVQKAKGDVQVRKLSQFFNWLFKGINKKIYPITVKDQFDTLYSYRIGRHTSAKDYVFLYEKLYKNEVALWQK